MTDSQKHSILKCICELHEKSFETISMYAKIEKVEELDLTYMIEYEDFNFMATGEEYSLYLDLDSEWQDTITGESLNLREVF